jgi:hypothetical protein
MELILERIDSLHQELHSLTIKLGPLVDASSLNTVSGDEASGHAWNSECTIRGVAQNLGRIVEHGVEERFEQRWREVTSERNEFFSPTPSPSNDSYLSESSDGSPAPRVVGQWPEVGQRPNFMGRNDHAIFPHVANGMAGGHPALAQQ